MGADKEDLKLRIELERDPMKRLQLRSALRKLLEDEVHRALEIPPRREY